MIILSNERLKFLDGLRGFSILLVVLFHLYARWPEFFPYEGKYSDGVFAYGWLGVRIFFIISGYVIFMTLDRCHGFFDFMWRRWLRLFPAMFFATAIIFFTVEIFPERPFGRPQLRDVIPGLLFLEPDWLSSVFGMNFGQLEGGFWSLYVEVKFYVIVGLIYFLKVKKEYIPSILLGLFLFATLAVVGRKLNDSAFFLQLHNITEGLGFRQFGWFAAGCYYSLGHGSGNKKLIYTALAVSLLSCLEIKGLDWVSKVYALFFVMIFHMCIVNHYFQKFFSSKIWIFFGFISYPLFLVNENMGVAMIVKIGNVFQGAPSFFIPVMPLVALICLSWLIAKYLEPAGKRSILFLSEILIKK